MDGGRHPNHNFYATGKQVWYIKLLLNQCFVRLIDDKWVFKSF